jgi:hypothetical protein
MYLDGWTEHSRPPEDGNHIQKYVGVELERIINKKSTTS